MKVILNISEKAIKKAKAVILLNTDCDETSIDKAIEECEQEEVTELPDAPMGIPMLKENMNIQIGLSVIAIVYKLKILEDEKAKDH